MRTEKNYTGGNSLSVDFKADVSAKVMPKIIDKGVNENGFTLFHLDNGQTVTELRYIHEYGKPMPKDKGKVHPQHFKGRTPDTTKPERW